MLVSCGKISAISQLNSMVAPMVNTTCAMPSPNTICRIAVSLGSENSRPIENIRNTTPNSASAWVVALSSAKPSACGPISIPTTR